MILLSLFILSRRFLFFGLLGGKKSSAYRAYTAAYRGRVFWGSSLIAGVTIPVNTATAATFTLYNPVSSGVNVELISLDLGWPAANASVVGTILGSVSAQVPTGTLTEGGYKGPALVGGSSAPLAKLYTVATIVAITSHIPLITLSTVTDTMNPSHVDFDGKLILSPGSLITLTSTPVQSLAAIPTFFWAEWPL